MHGTEDHLEGPQGSVNLFARDSATLSFEPLVRQAAPLLLRQQVAGIRVSSQSWLGMFGRRVFHQVRLADSTAKGLLRSSKLCIEELGIGASRVLGSQGICPCFTSSTASRLFVGARHVYWTREHCLFAPLCVICSCPVTIDGAVAPRIVAVALRISLGGPAPMVLESQVS